MCSDFWGSGDNIGRHSLFPGEWSQKCFSMEDPRQKCSNISNFAQWELSERNFSKGGNNFSFLNKTKLLR